MTLMKLCSSNCLLSVVLLLTLASVGRSIEDKCEACRIIADELTNRLDGEGTKNHIDMRHRIDKSGKRHGKVIDYKMSELRIVELLDDLCDICKSYTWGYRIPEGGGTLSLGWVSNKASQAISYRYMSKEEKRGRQSELTAYCGRLVEDYEEDLTEVIRNGVDDIIEIFDKLCVELDKACSSTERKTPPQDEL